MDKLELFEKIFQGKATYLFSAVREYCDSNGLKDLLVSRPLRNSPCNLIRPCDSQFACAAESIQHNPFPFLNDDCPYRREYAMFIMKKIQSNPQLFLTHNSYPIRELAKSFI